MNYLEHISRLQTQPPFTQPSFLGHDFLLLCGPGMRVPLSCRLIHEASTLDRMVLLQTLLGHCLRVN